VVVADKDLVLAFAYLPPPSEELEQLEWFCGHSNLQIITGADANAHHIVWGSFDTNRVGESLLEFIICRKLEVSNRGNEPTFVTQRWKEVTDITVGSPYISTQGGKWYVSNEPSHLDHRYICLEINEVDKPIVMYRNPWNTSWVQYRESLRESLKMVRPDMKNAYDIKEGSEQL
jgi:hypothetical protein